VQGTYVHLGRKGESTLAPEGPKSFPLRSAEIMEISMVAGWVVAPKVILVSVLRIIIIMECISLCSKKFAIQEDLHVHCNHLCHCCGCFNVTTPRDVQFLHLF
jgi:hypothetical protein